LFRKLLSIYYVTLKVISLHWVKKRETFPVQSPLITFRSERNGKQRHCTCFHYVTYIFSPSFCKKITGIFWLCIFGIVLFLMMSDIDKVLNRRHQSIGDPYSLSNILSLLYPWRWDPIGCFETSVNSDHSSLLKIPIERGSFQVF
jgi:hypothetical protein